METNNIWDQHHNDAQADIILVAIDNIEFRVSSWYLKQKRYAAALYVLYYVNDCSDFVKGLLEIPSTESLAHAPIHLNQTSDHVRTMIDLVYSSGTQFHLSAIQCNALLELCDHLQMPTINETILRMATAQLDDTKAFGLSPWECFKLAALRDDPDLCQKAILAFKVHGYDFHDICSQQQSFYSDIPNRYFATLLVNNYTPYNGTHIQKDWPGIARKFEKLKSGDL
jgi:hypothetical protein